MQTPLGAHPGHDPRKRRRTSLSISPYPGAPGTWLLEDSLTIPEDRDRVFEFFGDARNLQRITPSRLDFRIASMTPETMGVGTVIEYRLKLRGVPFRWRSLIQAWDPPHRFVDVQLNGPYGLWIHEYSFEAVPEGTLVRDRVVYRAPGGPLIHRWFVRPDLTEIFGFRKQALVTIFGNRKA